MLKFHDPKPSLDCLVEIHKQSALEEAEGPEPWPKERTMTIWKLTEGRGLTDAGIKVLVNNEWNEMGVAATGQGIVRMFA